MSAASAPRPSSTLRALGDLVVPRRAIEFGPDAVNRADLYLPRGHGPHPVVIAVHGGFWQSRFSRRYMRPLCAWLARAGIAVWNIEYRALGSGGEWPVMFEDVARAVDALADIAGEHELDLARVGAVGHSAGSHLALWAAARPRLPAGAPGAGPVVSPRAVAGLAPVSDIESFPRLVRPSGEISVLLGGTPEEMPGRWAIANPARSLPLGVPVLMVRAAEDGQIPERLTHSYIAAARAAGDRVDVVDIPGAHRTPADPRRRDLGVVTTWLREELGS